MGYENLQHRCFLEARVAEKTATTSVRQHRVSPASIDCREVSLSPLLPRLHYGFRLPSLGLACSIVVREVRLLFMWQ